jgi:hypothetical protein
VGSVLIFKGRPTLTRAAGSWEEEMSVATQQACVSSRCHLASAAISRRKRHSPTIAAKRGRYVYAAPFVIAKSLAFCYSLAHYGNTNATYAGAHSEPTFTSRFKDSYIGSVFKLRITAPAAPHVS